jgi:hypothetical protein
MNMLKTVLTGLSFGGLVMASTDADAQRRTTYMGDRDDLSPATLTLGAASSVTPAPAVFIEFKKNMIEQNYVVGSLTASAQFSGKALGSRAADAPMPPSYYAAVNGLNRVQIGGELGPQLIVNDNINMMLGPQVAFNGYMNSKGFTFGGLDIGIVARAAVTISDSFSINAFAVHPLAASPGQKIMQAAFGENYDNISVKQGGIKDTRFGVGLAFHFGSARGY